MNKDIIARPEPLQPEYIPEHFVDRKREQTALSNLLTDPGRNLHIQGARGTGKTHLTLSILEEVEAKTCYIDCSLHDTQYKALRQLYQTVTEKAAPTGYHTSKLQREIKSRTTEMDTVIVLDEVDFLLLNDGDDLLYYLSRMNSGNTTVAVITSQIESLRQELEERVHSSFQPYPVHFEPYSGEELYKILLHRARNALEPHSLQRAALTFIVSRSSNITIGLQWLFTAAQNTDSAITEDIVREIRSQVYQRYTNLLLEPFTDHHDLLYQAIQELIEEQEDSVVQSGAIYDRYQDICQSYEGEEPLSQRRVSDYLKHFELLELIQAEYHYGGSKGKTRDIRLS